MANRKPLVITSGVIQRLQDGDTIAGTDVDGAFLLLTDDLDLYVETDGDDSTGDGTQLAPFATVTRALEEATHYAPFGDTTITVHVGEGIFSEPAALSFSWPFGGSLTVDGETENQTGRSFDNFDVSTSTEAGVTNLQYFECDVTLSSGTAEVGQFVGVTSASGGTNPNTLLGFHPITAVSGTTLTIRVYQRQGVTALPSGSITGNITLFRTVLSFPAANAGLNFTGTNAGMWTGLALTRAGLPSATNSGIVLSASSIIANTVGVHNFATLIAVINSSGIRLDNGFGSKTGFSGWLCRDNAWALFGTYFTNGTADNAVLSSRGSYMRMATGRITACGGGTGGIVLSTDNSLIEFVGSNTFSYQHAAGSYALFADFNSVIYYGAPTLVSVDNTAFAARGSFAVLPPQKPEYSYNTYTSVTNYERLAQYWSSNVARLETQKGTSGTARALALGTDSTIRLQINADGTISLPTYANLPTTEPSAGSPGTLWLDASDSNSAILKVTTS